MYAMILLYVTPPANLVQVGGGWQDHDLSDLTLTWMSANIEKLLSLDYEYLATLPTPCYPWGEQAPHDPRTGIFSLANEITRQLPTCTNDVTHEKIHPSVLRQKQILTQLQANINKNPTLICELLPLEKEMRKNWPYVPGKVPHKDAQTEVKSNDSTGTSIFDLVFSKGKQLGQQTYRQITHTEIVKDASGPVYGKNWLGCHIDETPFGCYLQEWDEKN